MDRTQILLATLLTVGATVVNASEALTAEARGITKTFAESLVGEVKQSMKASGPVATISMCHDRAPKIAQEVASAAGWHVGRTSLKLRNPNNAPDSWELAVLKSFEERKAKGEPVKTLEYAAVVEQGGQKMFRYMKAIPTGEPCLHCHAAEIKPPVESTLQQFYPQDKARGFSLGDIRGAFTLSKNL